MKGATKHRLIQEIRWKDLKTRKATHELLLYFKIVNNLCPSYLLIYYPYKLVKLNKLLPTNGLIVSLATLCVLKDIFSLYYYLVE